MCLFHKCKIYISDYLKNIMPHLYKIRGGWEKEHLAKFILSKFSFLAEPSTIADDIGSDIFCTLFKIKDKKYLIPQNSFAIQIKSNENEIKITNKKDYLDGLEIPFFVGVINKEKTKITIYAGEYISDYFSSSLPNIKKEVYIQLIEKRYEPLEMWKVGQNKVYLYFPKVVEIPIDYDYLSNPEKIEDLFSICRLIQENISSKTGNEYIFRKFNSNYLYIYAGSGSAQHFRDNFKKRLSEVFHNLKWLYTSKSLSKQEVKEEFEIYKKFYLDLLKKEGSLPEYLINPFNELDNLMR